MSQSQKKSALETPDAVVERDEENPNEMEGDTKATHTTEGRGGGRLTASATGGGGAEEKGTLLRADEAKRSDR